MTAFEELGVAAARVGRAGSPLDDGGLQVAPNAGRDGPAIAFGSSTYLITWIEGSTLYTRRYAIGGAAIDPAPVPIRTVNPFNTYYASRIAVAWNGNAFLVVWIEDGHPDAQSRTFYCSTIGVDGTVSAARPIIGVSFYDSDPDVACNSQTCLIIWGRMSFPPFEGPPTRTGTWAVHVASDGAPIGGASPFIEMPDLYTRGATVASNGRDFLVALDGSRDLIVVPITATGARVTVGSPKTLFRWFGSIQSNITPDANGYAISWRYPKPSSVPYDPRILTNQWYLAVAHLNSGGDRYTGTFTSINVATSDLTFDLARLSTATNRQGDTAVTIREQLPGSVPRVRAYFDWEMTPMPALPMAPRNVAVNGSRDNFVVSWEPTSNDATGFAVEGLSRGISYSLYVVPGDQRNVSINYPYDAVRVIALNAGGMSEPSELVPVVKPVPRKRVTRSR